MRSLSIDRARLPATLNRANTATIGTATHRNSSHPPWCANIAARRVGSSAVMTGDGGTIRDHRRAPVVCYGVSMRRMVEETIEVIRPALQADGGDIVLRDVNEETGVVSVTLVGACTTCPASDQTMKAGIERIMKDRIDGVTEVVQVA